MARIRILPLDDEIEAAEDATVMGAAQALGYYWPTTCGGEGRCTTCACEVLEGARWLTPMGRGERRTLEDERGPGVALNNIRLACQARLLPGPAVVTVRKAGVRRSEEESEG